MVITLGTGFGTAVLSQGQLVPHMELSQHPFRHGETYDEQVGDVARRNVGKKIWSKRVHKAIAVLDSVFMFDHLYVGGGNAARLQGPLGRTGQRDRSERRTARRHSLVGSARPVTRLTHPCGNQMSDGHVEPP